MRLRAADVPHVANDNPAIVRRSGSFDLKPVDPEAFALSERGDVDEDDVGGIAFPALLSLAKPVQSVGIASRLRPPVAIDHGKPDSAIEAQIAKIGSLSVDCKRQGLARNFAAAAVDTDQ